MKKWYALLACLVVLLPVCAHAYSDGDFQVWNTEVEEWKINKEWKLALEQEFRWGDSAHEFFYQHYDGSIFYSLNQYLTFGAGYRYIESLVKKDFKVEQDPALMASIAWDLGGFKFEDRNRLEYQHFAYQDDAWRYRNKFTVKLPWKFTRFEIQPYFADEIFVRSSHSTMLSQNRFSSGMGMSLTKNIKAELYYMLVSSKGKDVWTDANVLGTKVKIAF